VLELLIVLICVSILASGVLAVMLNSLMAAVVSAGLAGLFSAAAFLLLAAPDVAMTEASIGSGLLTFIFLYTIRKTDNGGEGRG
jgi:energy-converting hydrogenase B subunit D